MLGETNSFFKVAITQCVVRNLVDVVVVLSKFLQKSRWFQSRVMRRTKKGDTTRVPDFHTLRGVCGHPVIDEVNFRNLFYKLPFHMRVFFEVISS